MKEIIYKLEKGKNDVDYEIFRIIPRRLGKKFVAFCKRIKNSLLLLWF
jgi:hypothetical protein